MLSPVTRQHRANTPAFGLLIGITREGPVVTWKGVVSRYGFPAPARSRTPLTSLATSARKGLVSEQQRPHHQANVVVLKMDNRYRWRGCMRTPGCYSYTVVTTSDKETRQIGLCWYLIRCCQVKRLCLDAMSTLLQLLRSHHNPIRFVSPINNDRWNPKNLP